jgi:hypothetical protein
MAVLKDVADPRKARGKQVEWDFIWGVIATAMLSGQRGAAAIAHWAARQAGPLLAAFRPRTGRIPSESTLRRALQRVDIVALERQVAQVEQSETPQGPLPGDGPAGYAIDGKHVRGAGAHACRRCW